MHIDAPGPHGGQPVFTAGAPLQNASTVAVLVHGRGGAAADMLAFARELGQPGFGYLAPQAREHTWYPQSFLAPIEANEPWLSSALAALKDVVGKALDAAGPPERLMLLGFSQGGCLTLEYTARNPRSYGAVVGLSAGLIGPEGTPRSYQGSLDGVPVFLGCSDVDPHIPVERVHETAEVLSGMGASVDKRIYPGMGHTVNADELTAVRELAERIARSA